MSDLDHLRDLARSLTVERFVARFPWDFLVVLSTESTSTIQYATRKSAPAITLTPLSELGSDAAQSVWPLVKTASQSTPGGATILVGRSHACDVALEDASVSKTHARITLARGHAATLEDAGSHNGTRLRTERLEPRVPVEIRSGDLITFGSVVTLLADAKALHEVLARGA